MKIFENKTDNKKENAIKKGTVVPKGAVNLGWYSSDEISPANSLSVVDFSQNIPEATVPASLAETDSIMYADEFGVLRYAQSDPYRSQLKHSPILPSAEVSISDKVLDLSSQDGLNFTTSIDNLSTKIFAHSYYVSNHFIIQNNDFPVFTKIISSLPVENPDSLNIKVVDQNGIKYQNENGEERYKIILEKYLPNGGNILASTSFYRIIVLLEDINPSNLSLVYDKYEITSDSLPKNQFLGYKETINSVNLYEQVQEEAEVVDFSSEDKRVYAVQMFSHKENNLLKHKNDEPGWKAYVPRKAFQDPRTFQSFNWRVVAKINYDYGLIQGRTSPIVRAAVIKRSSESRTQYPYVFSNLEQFNINSQRLIMQNPASPNVTDKNLASYWEVSLLDPNIQNYNYDILFWCPTSAILQEEYIAIRRLLSNGTSVFIDCSNLDISSSSSSGLSLFGVNYSAQNRSSGLLKLSSSYSNGKTTFNGWNMPEYSHSTGNETYGIFGIRKSLINSQLSQIKSFSNSSDWTNAESSTIAYLQDGSSYYSVIFKKNYISDQNTNSSTTQMPQGVYFCSNAIGTYLNDSYVNSVIGTSVANTGDRNGLTFSSSSINSITEGPAKLFYNIVLESIKNKNISSTSVQSQSSILWSVSPWRTSWTINGRKINNKINILTDKEKQDYNFSEKTEITTDANAQAASTKFCRQISSSLANVFDLDFGQNSSINSSIVNRDYSNVTFYIECTNPNVEFLNFGSLGNDQYFYSNNRSPYSVYKLSTAAKNQMQLARTVGIDAHSKVNSAEIDFSLVHYPYILVDESEYTSLISDNKKIPSRYLGDTQLVKNYDFSLKNEFSVTKVTETNSTYSVSWEAPFSVKMQGTGVVKNAIVRNENRTARIERSISDVAENYLTISNVNSPFNKMKYSSKIFSRTDILAIDQDSTIVTQNNFHYTDDIPRSKRTLGYKVKYLTDSNDNNTETMTYSASKFTAFESSFIDPASLEALENGNGKWTIGVKDNVSDTKVSLYNLAQHFIRYIANSLSGLYNPEKFGDLYDGDALNAFLSKTWPAGTFSGINSPMTGLRMFSTRYASTYASRIFILNSSIDAATSGSPSSNNSQRYIGIKNNYVRYIQYTLNCQASNIGLTKKLAIDGEYGPKVSSAVLLFQRKKSVSFFDGVVDSETKSVLAHFWLDLKINNPDQLQQLINEAPDDEVKEYIYSAIAFSDISSVGNSEYRRISFTGTKGSSYINDYIIVKVPDGTQTLHGFYFVSGQWKTKVKHVYLYDKDLVSGGKHVIPNYGRTSIKPFSNRPINVTVPENDAYYIDIAERKGIKYVMLELVGEKINEHGPYAEGFSIGDIIFDVTVNETVQVFEDEQGAVSGYAEGKIKGTATIDANGYSVVDLNRPLNLVANTASSSTLTISEISFNNIYVDAEDLVHLQTDRYVNPNYNSTTPFYFYQNGTQNNSPITYSLNNQNLNFSLQPVNTGNITISQVPTITSAQKTNISPASSESIANFSVAAANTLNKYVLSSVNNKSFNLQTDPVVTEVTSYYLADADNIAATLRNNISTISAKDGIVVLANSTGQPIGFPNFASHASSNSDIDVTFGDMVLNWNLNNGTEPPGITWGFYNVTTKNFYGKKISYNQYISGGPNNIYIALLAYDMDGNPQTGNILNGDSFSVTHSALPTKIIAPLYSVKAKGLSKVGISAPPANLSKFDSWFIGVGRGKFFKSVQIPIGQYTNFLKEYAGRSLRCLYDTTSFVSSSSDFFGTGYYDVREENPIVVSDNEIKLRHGSVHVYQRQIDKQSIEGRFTDAKPILPWLKVEIYNSSTNSWLLIDEDLILDYNKNTGNIIFKKEIVPSNEKNIRVTYVVKNRDIIIRHINGSEIAINPFSPVSDISDKPIYIYLLPTKIEYIDKPEYSGTINYSYSSSINSSSNYNIFDPSKAEYNPLALLLGTINIISKNDFDNINFLDLRVRGGGTSGMHDEKTLAKLDQNVASFSDIYTGKGYIYPNGGYVIVKIPKEVKNYFDSEEQLYSIVRSNLTAGVSFDIQDLDGNDWRTL